MESLRECALGWLDEGMTPLQVAQFTGATVDQVRQWDKERTLGKNPVLELMHQGKTCAEIAQALGISEEAAHYLVVDTWKHDKERK